MDNALTVSQMLFTWDTTNLCIVFEQWHIRTTPGLVFSLLAVVLIAMGYEALRAASRVYEKSIDARKNSAPSEYHFSCPPPPPSITPAPTRTRHLLLLLFAILDVPPNHVTAYLDILFFFDGFLQSYFQGQDDGSPARGPCVLRADP